MEDEPATRAIFNTIFGRAGSKATRVRVDSRTNPKVVLCRCGWLTLYTTDRRAAKRLLDEIPDRWHMNFSATPSWVHAYVRRKRRIIWANSCCQYVLIDPSRLVIHHRHRVGSLVPGESSLVAEHWPYYSGKGDSVYIKRRIETGPSCAIRRKGKPVAWALTHGDGSLGFLYVRKPWRGQGMARTISTVLSQRLLRKGISPFLFIEKKNRASIRLTEAMGFERYGSYAWFAAAPGVT